MPAAFPACRWIRQKASQSAVSSDNVMSLFFPPPVFLKFLEVYTSKATQEAVLLVCK